MRYWRLAENACRWSRLPTGEPFDYTHGPEDTVEAESQAAPVLKEPARTRERAKINKKDSARARMMGGLLLRRMDGWSYLCLGSQPAKASCFGVKLGNFQRG